MGVPRYWVGMSATEDIGNNEFKVESPMWKVWFLPRKGRVKGEEMQSWLTDYRFLFFALQGTKVAFVAALA